MVEDFSKCVLSASVYYMIKYVMKEGHIEEGHIEKGFTEVRHIMEEYTKDI